MENVLKKKFWNKNVVHASVSMYERDSSEEILRVTDSQSGVFFPEERDSLTNSVMIIFDTFCQLLRPHDGKDSMINVTIRFKSVPVRPNLQVTFTSNRSGKNDNS